MLKDSESEVVQSCLTLCDPMDRSPPGSSVYGIFQAISLSKSIECTSKERSKGNDEL